MVGRRSATARASDRVWGSDSRAVSLSVGVEPGELFKAMAQSPPRRRLGRQVMQPGKGMRSHTRPPVDVMTNH